MYNDTWGGEGGQGEEIRCSQTIHQPRASHIFNPGVLIWVVDRKEPSFFKVNRGKSLRNFSNQLGKLILGYVVQLLKNCGDFSPSAPNPPNLGLIEFQTEVNLTPEY